ncbi:MAG: MnhB domain-containing protein [Planctomycetota bacterium]|jgi:multicomponent Na+:H+ antiporter subunit B
MTTIVKTITKLINVPIFLFGLYIIFGGHSGPGGGFAGGVILGATYVLLMLAFGRNFVERKLSPSAALKLGCLGMLLFLAIAITGLFFSPLSFFWNFLQQKYPDLITSGTISIAEFVVGLLVGSLTFLVILSISIFRPSNQ